MIDYDKAVPINLSSTETRILGCLLEKERTTPEYYPLSLNSLVTACNQTTNRDPIVNYSEKTVEQGLDLLRQKKLAMLIHTAGARVAKYRHTFLDLYNLNSREVAIICVLMLRGPQTPGELRSRTERMCGAMSLSDLERLLDELSAGDDPLVKVIQRVPARRKSVTRICSHLIPKPTNRPQIGRRPSNRLRRNRVWTNSRASSKT